MTAMSYGLRISRPGYPDHTIYFPNLWEAVDAALDHEAPGLRLAVVTEERGPDGWRVVDVAEVD